MPRAKQKSILNPLPISESLVRSGPCLNLQPPALERRDRRKEEIIDGVYSEKENKCIV